MMTSSCRTGADRRQCFQETSLKTQECGPIPRRPDSPKIQLEQEKRLRRAIANSNERRRMQSINAGFQSLKTIIPHQDGEKLSKAAILQQASDYIFQLEHDKAQLLSENDELKQMLQELGKSPQDHFQSSLPPKRKKRDTESSDEGIGLSCGDVDEHAVDEIKQEIHEIRGQLDAEHRRCILLAKQTCSGENDMYKAGLVPDEKESKEDLHHDWKEKSKDEIAQHFPLNCTPSPPPVVPYEATSFLTHVHNVNNCLSVSRRNLDTIVEAIRHLEGDTILLDKSVPQSCSVSRIPLSAESNADNSCEHDDCDSDTSTNFSTSAGKNSNATVSSTLLGPSVTVAPAHGLQTETLLSRHPLHAASLHSQLLTNTKREEPTIQLSLFHASAMSTCPPSQLSHISSEPNHNS